MATYYSQGSDNWSTLANWDTNQGGGGSDPASVADMDDDTFIIQAGHTVTMDCDMSGFTNGIAGLTITGSDGTPGMLVFKYSDDGTYHLKIKTGTTIAGTSSVTNYGRILANSDGVWGNTGALPFGRKAIIQLAGTAYINSAYLNISLYCTQPTNTYVTTYKSLKTVSSINTSTDVITMSAAHGWSNGTLVRVRSSGDLPGGLSSEVLYYVGDASGADLKLLGGYSTGPVIDITSSGSGTIEIYDGHTDTGTATLNVFEDVTSDTPWITTDGHDYVVLASYVINSTTWDFQRVQLTTINASSIVLSANVDSVQLPGAKIYLVSRNVSIRTDSTSASSPTGVIWNSTASSTSVLILQCEIRATQVPATGATYYGSVGVRVYGTVTFSGVVSGVATGLGNLPGSYTISGIILTCSSGITGSTVVLSSFTGTVACCSNGVDAIVNATVGGTIECCNSATQSLSNCTVSSTIRYCYAASIVCGGTTYSGWIHSCIYACNQNIGYANRHCTYSGTIQACQSFNYVPAHEAIVTGTIKECWRGIYTGGVILCGATLSGNGMDIAPYRGTVVGYSTSLNSTVQCGLYKEVDSVYMGESRAGVRIQDLGGNAGYIGVWTLGGFTKSAAYSVGTHGTPPVSSDIIHETTFEDNDRLNWVEFGFPASANVPLTITFYGKLTGTSAWTTRPTIGIYDPRYGWQDASEDLNVSSEMASNTDWQTLTATYTVTWDREVRIRMQGKGGDAGGTGTEKLYWFYKVQHGSRVYGPAAAIM